MDETEVIETPTDQTEAVENEETQVKTEPESEEVEITIEGEEPDPKEPEEAPEWVKEVRKQNRELQKKVKEYEDKLKQQAEPKKPVLPPKPKLADFDFDEDKFEAAMTDWFEAKKSVEAEEQRVKTEQQKAQEAYLKRLEDYNERKAVSRLKDFDDAEEQVKTTLNPMQQSIIVKHAKAPEQVVYVLGTKPEKAKEFQSIQDPIEFALAIRELENKLKVTPKVQKPAPEVIPTGSSKASGADKMLEQLEAEAEKTGDRSKILAYKRKLRAERT